MDTTQIAETFGVFTEVTTTEAYVEGGGDGYRSVVMLTNRGDSIYGRTVSAYWNLTPDEAEALGIELIKKAERCRVGEDA
jgi:hypothetical protein